MNEETITTLNRLNLVFYETFSNAFSESRSEPWPGWSRVLGQLGPNLPRSVLDVGCGNGRFARFLNGRLEERFEYVGVDSSAALLAIAKADLEEVDAEVSLIERDIISAATLPSGRFDLIAAFGLLHHVPSFEKRRALVSDLAMQLSPGGLLALTFWQFGSHQRFEKKVVHWREYNEQATESIDLSELEEGDMMLRWDRGGHGFRYCHFADDAEIERLLSSLPVHLIDRFDDDGKTHDLNHYVVLGGNE